MFGLTGNNPANDPDKKPIKSHSSFKPNYSLYQTMLYGLNQPHFAMEVVGDDKINLRCNTDIDTFNLKAPLMFPVKMYHDYFFVPLRAILPHNSDLLVTNPLTGDDVVAKDVNCGFDPTYVIRMIARANDLLGQVSNDQGSYFTQSVYFWTHWLATFFTTMQLSEPFCSAGSLLNTLGHNTDDWIFQHEYRKSDGHEYTYDEVVEACLTLIHECVESFDFTIAKPVNTNGVYTFTTIGMTCNVQVDKVQDSNKFAIIGWRQFLRLLREGAPIRDIAGVTLTSAGTTKNLLKMKYSDLGLDVLNKGNTRFKFNFVSASDFNSYASDVQKFINLSRVLAYQLVNVQFYTNDGVDYLYNCELYHQNQLCLANMMNQDISGYNIYTPGKLLYVLNGTNREYDSCSAAFLNKVIDDRQATTPMDSYQNYGDYATASAWKPGCGIMIVPFLYNIFGYQRSLKYRDYFVGSKCRPLAVGDVTVNVQSNMVNVVDITRNIMRQRFFNQVNRLGRSLKEYSRGIFGVTPMPDPHEPILLASTCDVVGASETDSTDPSANLSTQNTTSSKLRNSTSKYAFEITPSEFGVLIGITHFDAVRPYTCVTERPFYHVDRFDMFNPYMQNTGDQAVYQSELDNFVTNTNTNRNFAYQLRYSEYKQRVDRAVGGFAAGLLPGFAFPMTKYDLHELDGSTSKTIEINPDFIRARSEDFDQFFSALPYYCQAGYFHFMLRNDLQVDAVRPMESAPTIL